MPRPEIPEWMNSIAPNAKPGSAELAKIYKCYQTNISQEVKEGRILPPTHFIESCRTFDGKNKGTRDLQKWEMKAVRAHVAQRQKEFDLKQVKKDWHEKA